MSIAGLVYYRQNGQRTVIILPRLNDQRSGKNRVVRFQWWQLVGRMENIPIYLNASWTMYREPVNDYAPYKAQAQNSDGSGEVIMADTSSLA